MLSEELASRGHEVTIAAPTGQLSERARAAGRRLPGLRVDDGFRFRPPSRAVSFARDTARMIRLLRGGRFDVVDVHGSQDTWVTVAARLRLRRPGCLVLTRHNTKRVRTGWPNRLLYGRLIDHLIVVDASVKALYQAYFDDGTLDPAAVAVVPSAYRAEIFHPGVDGAGVRRELQVPEGAWVLGVAGRLVPDKGHIHLMRAAAALRARGRRVLLVFAGMGPGEEDLRRQAASLGLAGDVRFLGFRSDVAQVMAALDVSVLPSVGCDASSATIKEAMAVGVPVVASDIGGARFLIDDGRTGLVVPPGDEPALASAVERLMTGPGRARAMAAAAQDEVARRFSVSRLADETLAAYQAALEGRGAARRAAAGRAAAVRREGRPA